MTSKEQLRKYNKVFEILSLEEKKAEIDGLIKKISEWKK